MAFNQDLQDLIDSKDISQYSEEANKPKLGKIIANSSARYKLNSTFFNYIIDSYWYSGADYFMMVQTLFYGEYVPSYDEMNKFIQKMNEPQFIEKDQARYFDTLKRRLSGQLYEDFPPEYMNLVPENFDFFVKSESEHVNRIPLFVETLTDKNIKYLTEENIQILVDWMLLGLNLGRYGHLFKPSMYLKIFTDEELIKYSIKFDTVFRVISSEISKELLFKIFDETPENTHHIGGYDWANHQTEIMLSKADIMKYSRFLHLSDQPVANIVEKEVCKEFDLPAISLVGRTDYTIEELLQHEYTDIKIIGQNIIRQRFVTEEEVLQHKELFDPQMIDIFPFCISEDGWKALNTFHKRRVKYDKNKSNFINVVRYYTDNISFTFENFQYLINKLKPTNNDQTYTIKFLGQRADDVNLEFIDLIRPIYSLYK